MEKMVNIYYGGERRCYHLCFFPTDFTSLLSYSVVFFYFQDPISFERILFYTTANF